LPGAFDDGFLVGGKSAALGKEGADLPLELTLGPVALETRVFVEGALPRVFEPDQIRQMGPRKFEQLFDRQWAWGAVGGFPHRRCGNVALRCGRFAKG